MTANPETHRCTWWIFVGACEKLDTSLVIIYRYLHLASTWVVFTSGTSLFLQNLNNFLYNSLFLSRKDEHQDQNTWHRFQNVSFTARLITVPNLLPNTGVQLARHQTPGSPLSWGVQACLESKITRLCHGFVGCQEVQQKKLQHQRLQRQISQEVRMVKKVSPPQCPCESLPCLKKTSKIHVQLNAGFKLLGSIVSKVNLGMNLRRISNHKILA